MSFGGGSSEDDAQSTFTTFSCRTSRSDSRDAGAVELSSRLVKAAAKGNLEEVCNVLDSTSLGVGALRLRGTTGLHEASKNGHFHVVADMLRRGTDTKLLNRNGCTALHFSALCKDKLKALEVAKLLIEANSSVNVTNERLDTPLHFAAYCRPTEHSGSLVRELLNAKGNVNARNLNSDTPLMNAATMANVEVINILAEAEADLGIRNKIEKTAYEIAIDNGNLEVAQALERAQDPLMKLTDVTHQMRTALSQIQTADMLKEEVKSQAEKSEAYAAVAAMILVKLDPLQRAAAVEHALCTTRWIVHSPPTTPSIVIQQQLLQVLIVLQLLCSQPGCSRMMRDLGVGEVLPTLENLALKHKIGRTDILIDIRRAVHEPNIDRSESSTPLSLYSYCTRQITPAQSWHSMLTASRLAESSSPLNDGNEFSPRKQQRQRPSGLSNNTSVMSGNSSFVASALGPDPSPGAIPVSHLAGGLTPLSPSGASVQACAPEIPVEKQEACAPEIPAEKHEVLAEKKQEDAKLPDVMSKAASCTEPVSSGGAESQAPSHARSQSCTVC
eukprot:TRINITY_DN17903_c0_g3_i1.p1 TRINITY_DN17903_c0_g3~~TRINITY_DN17903_c0_g3_i1.p1  ORF type:complete len:557 (-),score=51.16 TRINITY_DN17903_c0_g3_i1:30-1700(-)